MGNQCCGPRDDADKRKAAGTLSGGQNYRNMLSWREPSDDVARFDTAYAAKDIAEFVRLCSSMCEIESLDERMHPWAAEPRTIGALAATQLAIFASREAEPEIKDEIRRADGIRVLVALLSSPDEDRLHAAIVALSFLSVDNVPNCREMFECGGLPPLIRGLRSELDGLRAACAQTSRNIFMVDIAYRKEFVSLGGVAALIPLLYPAPDQPDAAPQYTQLETLYHLEDLILDDDKELPEFIAELRRLDITKQLAVLQKHDDPDLADAANVLYLRLTQ